MLDLPHRSTKLLMKKGLQITVSVLKNSLWSQAMEPKLISNTKYCQIVSTSWQPKFPLANKERGLEEYWSRRPWIFVSKNRWGSRVLVGTSTHILLKTHQNLIVDFLWNNKYCLWFTFWEKISFFYYRNKLTEKLLVALLGLDLLQVELELFSFKNVTVWSSTLARSWRDGC